MQIPRYSKSGLIGLLSFILTLTCWLSCWTVGWAAAPGAPGAPSFDHAEGGKVFYTSLPAATGAPASSHMLQTPLSEIQYLGTLEGLSSDLPYFLLAAKPCTDCSQDRAVIALRPTPGSKPDSFVYPGRIVDPKSGGMVNESRMFYGRCVPRLNGNSLVVYQKELITSRHRKPRIQSSVLIAEPGASHLETRLLEAHLPRIQDTLVYVKRKQCHEIEGRNRRMPSKPLDLNPRYEDTGDTDDDEDSPVTAPNGPPTNATTPPATAPSH